MPTAILPQAVQNRAGVKVDLVFRIRAAVIFDLPTRITSLNVEFVSKWRNVSLPVQTWITVFEGDERFESIVWLAELESYIQ